MIADERAVFLDRETTTVPPTSARREAGRHAVILCNPGPGSFDHAIANSYCDAVRAAGQDVILRDLYAMGFDPVLRADERPTNAAFVRSNDVAAELDAIAWSDVFVLVYPIWFGSPPAMMKGYIERVLGSGVSPDAIRAGQPSELLGGKRLLSFTTSATSSVWLDQQGQERGLRGIIDDYLVHAFGMQSQEHRSFAHITPDLSKHFADGYLVDVRDQARRTCVQIASENGARHDVNAAESR